MANLRLITCFIAFILFSTGCGVKSVSLNPSPTITFPTNSIGKNLNLSIERFTDARGSEGKRIGIAFTGMANFRTPIIMDESIEDSPKKNLEMAFSNAGFNIFDNGSADLTIKGRINKFWVEERTGMSGERSEAEVEWDLVLIDKSGKKLWYGIKRANAISPNSLSDTTYQNEKTLKQAIEKVLRSILNDNDFITAIKNLRAEKGI